MMIETFRARTPADRIGCWFIYALAAGLAWVISPCSEPVDAQVYTSSAAAVRRELATRPASNGSGAEKAKATPGSTGLTAGKDPQPFPQTRKPRSAAQGCSSCSASDKSAELRPTGLHSAERVTTLLRAVVAEATWAERDHRAILHVLDRRAARAEIAVDEMARRYVSAFKRPPERRWVLELQPTCEQPASWPESLDWETWQPQCVLTVERVEAFLAGDSIDPCKGRAMHFGAPDLQPDINNAATAGWRVVNCGGTASIFYGERRGVVDAQEAKGNRADESSGRLSTRLERWSALADAVAHEPRDENNNSVLRYSGPLTKHRPDFQIRRSVFGNISADEYGDPCGFNVTGDKYCSAGCRAYGWQGGCARGQECRCEFYTNGLNIAWGTFDDECVPANDAWDCASPGASDQEARGAR